MHMIWLIKAVGLVGLICAGILVLYVLICAAITKGD